jgi:hypothetical protein
MILKNDNQGRIKALIGPKQLLIFLRSNNKKWFIAFILTFVAPFSL